MTSGENENLNCIVTALNLKSLSMYHVAQTLLHATLGHAVFGHATFLLVSYSLRETLSERLIFHDWKELNDREFNFLMSELSCATDSLSFTIPFVTGQYRGFFWRAGVWLRFEIVLLRR